MNKPIFLGQSNPDPFFTKMMKYKILPTEEQRKEIVEHFTKSGFIVENYQISIETIVPLKEYTQLGKETYSDT